MKKPRKPRHSKTAEGGPRDAKLASKMVTFIEDTVARRKPGAGAPMTIEEIHEGLANVEDGIKLVEQLNKRREFGDRIAFVRSTAGWTQTKLAKTLGVSRGAVSQWEANKTFPAAINLRKIATALNVSFDWLATGDGPSPLDDKDFQIAEGLRVTVEFKVQLDQNTTLEEAAKKLREIKESVEKQGVSVSASVQIGDQKIRL